MASFATVALTMAVIVLPGFAFGSGIPNAEGDDIERGVSVVSDYRPGEGTVRIGTTIYRLSPEAAGSLAQQLRARRSMTGHFGAATVIGVDATGRREIKGIRIVP